MHRQPPLGPRRPRPVPRGRSARRHRDALSGAQHGELDDAAACTACAARHRPDRAGPELSGAGVSRGRREVVRPGVAARARRHRPRAGARPARLGRERRCRGEIRPGTAAGRARAPSRPPRLVGLLPRSRNRGREGLDHIRLHLGQPLVAGTAHPGPRSCRTASRSGLVFPTPSAPPSPRRPRSFSLPGTAASCSRRASSRP